MKITGSDLFHGRYLLMLMDIYQKDIFEILVMQDLGVCLLKRIMHSAII